MQTVAVCYGVMSDGLSVLSVCHTSVLCQMAKYAIQFFYQLKF